MFIFCNFRIFLWYVSIHIVLQHQSCCKDRYNFQQKESSKKGVIKGRKSKYYRQNNGQKKTNWIDQPKPQSNQGVNLCAPVVRKVPAALVEPVLILLLKNLVISHEIGKEDWIVENEKQKIHTPEQFQMETQITASVTYPFKLIFMVICDTDIP